MSPTLSGEGGTPWTNWVGNQSFTPKATVEVDTEADVMRYVAEAAARDLAVRTFGARHSFTPIVETDGILLGLSRLRGIEIIS